MIAESTPNCKVTAMMIQPRGKDGAAIYTVFWSVAGRGEIARETSVAEFWYTLFNLPAPDYGERNYWSWEAGQ